MRKNHEVKDQWLLRWYGGQLDDHAVTRLQDIDDFLAESLEQRHVDREDARVEDLIAAVREVVYPDDTRGSTYIAYVSTTWPQPLL